MTHLPFGGWEKGGGQEKKKNCPKEYFFREWSESARKLIKWLFGHHSTSFLGTQAGRKEGMWGIKWQEVTCSPTGGKQTEPCSHDKDLGPKHFLLISYHQSRKKNGSLISFFWFPMISEKRRSVFHHSQEKGFPPLLIVMWFYKLAGSPVTARKAERSFLFFSWT